MIFDWPQLVMMLGVLQGLFLIIAVYTLKNRNKGANRVLTIFISLLVIALFGRVNYQNLSLNEFMGTIGWVFDAMIFVYGPVLYLYIKKLLI